MIQLLQSLKEQVKSLICGKFNFLNAKDFARKYIYCEGGEPGSKVHRIEHVSEICVHSLNNGHRCKT